jgi:hypothetical protein
LVNVIFANQVLIFGGGDDDERTLAGWGKVVSSAFQMLSAETQKRTSYCFFHLLSCVK